MDSVELYIVGDRRGPPTEWSQGKEDRKSWDQLGSIYAFFLNSQVGAFEDNMWHHFEHSISVIEASFGPTAREPLNKELLLAGDMQSQ